MRCYLGHSGVCAVCGVFEPVWVTLTRPATRETPAATTGPALCGDCETRRAVREWYASNLTLARQIYCAWTADEYLRSIGL